VKHSKFYIVCFFYLYAIFFLVPRPFYTFYLLFYFNLPYFFYSYAKHSPKVNFSVFFSNLTKLVQKKEDKSGLLQKKQLCCYKKRSMIIKNRNVVSMMSFEFLQAKGF